MAQLIYELIGVRGREMKLYDTKCVITTKKTAGSLLTGNFTDGEKTIFLCDVVGVQFKESGGLIGYLQFETPSMQMNNKSDNMFSENTFTFEHGKNGVTNALMQKVYQYVVDRVEEIKYGKIAPSAISQAAKTETPVRKEQEGKYAPTANKTSFSTAGNRPASGGQVSSNGWTCSCGRKHADYESSCVCGVTKWEMRKQNMQG